MEINSYMLKRALPNDEFTLDREVTIEFRNESIHHRDQEYCIDIHCNILGADIDLGQCVALGQCEHSKTLTYNEYFIC